MKKNIPMICNIISAILVITFIVKNAIDYSQYSTTLNSAPFYVWMLVNALYLIVPAIIVFVIGIVVKQQ